MHLLKHFFLLLWLLSHSISVIGCFCVTREDSVEQADVIFTGVVSSGMRYDESANCHYNLDGYVEFEIDSILKGKDDVSNCNKIAIIQSGTDCAIFFDEDSSYIVYATVVLEQATQSHFPFLTTSKCTGTRKLRQNGTQNQEAKIEKTLTPNRLLQNKTLLLASFMLNVGLIIFLIRFKRKVQNIYPDAGRNKS